MKKGIIYIITLAAICFILASCQKCIPTILCPYSNPQYLSVQGTDTTFIFFPNAFTPNGDGNNDFFDLSCHNIAAIDCKIYNAGGRKIYESNQLSQEIWYNGITYDTTMIFQCGWDGSLDGKVAPVGLYAVKVTATTASGKSLNLNGTVSLIGGQFLGDNSQNFDGSIYPEWKNAQFPVQFSNGRFDPNIPNGEAFIVSEVHNCL